MLISQCGDWQIFNLYSITQMWCSWILPSFIYESADWSVIWLDDECARVWLTSLLKDDFASPQYRRWTLPTKPNVWIIWIAQGILRCSLSEVSTSDDDLVIVCEQTPKTNQRSHKKHEKSKDMQIWFIGLRVSWKHSNQWKCCQVPKQNKKSYKWLCSHTL